MRARPVLISAALILGTWGAYFAFLWPRMLFRSAEGLVAGWDGVWADWAAHLSYAGVFAYRSPVAWFVEHPLAPGRPFAYPFVADAISGFLMRLGVDVVPAFIAPSVVATAVLLVALMLFYETVLRSRGQALLASTLFLATGGAGFRWFFQDLAAHPSWATLAFPPREYTHLRDLGVEWVNVVSSQLIPQRALLLGLPIGLLSLIVLLRWARAGFRDASWWRVVGLGTLVSTLVMVHVHSLLALALLCAGWAVLTPRHWRFWLAFGAAAAVPSLVVFAMLYGYNTPSGFLRWQPGWLANPARTGLDLLTFWWRNFGLFLPVAAIALWRARGTARPLLLAAGGLFLLSHVVIFQPFDWDNTKVLLWAVLVLAAPLSALLARIWARGLLGRLAAAALVLILTASGGLDLWRLSRTDRLVHVMSTPGELRLAAAFRALSQPTDRVLTSDYHLHWVPMHTGRPIVLGYQGWLWTYGFDVREDAQHVRTMYAGGPRSEELLRQYNVQYVVIGPSERRTLPVNELFFAARYAVVLEDADTRVYRVGGG